MTSRRETTIAKVRDKTSGEVNELRTEPDSSAARHHDMLGSIRHVFKTCGERMYKGPDTLAKLRKICDENCELTAEAQVAR